MTRATHWNRVARLTTGNPADYYTKDSGEGLKVAASEEDIKGTSPLLVPPGEIVHIYSKNGQRMASLVNHRWPGFRQVEVSRHMFRDHSKDVRQRKKGDERRQGREKG
uniref:Uncharacterized protein n=2 Tax=Lotharella globosa TaxID=91324 RepID=A0A7S3YP62_9EUKA